MLFADPQGIERYPLPLWMGLSMRVIGPVMLSYIISPHAYLYVPLHLFRWDSGDIPCTGTFTRVGVYFHGAQEPVPTASICRITISDIARNLTSYQCKFRPRTPSWIVVSCCIEAFLPAAVVLRFAFVMTSSPRDRLLLTCGPSSYIRQRLLSLRWRTRHWRVPNKS